MDKPASSKAGLNPPKHQMDNSVSPKIKDKIKKLIEKDNLIELIVTLDSSKAPLFAQISSPNSRWMMTHFCCRWNANNCLQFLLKNYFVSNPTKYIDFVNSPTVEGWTPLHLCSIWKAEKCFKVIHYYGGLNLNSEDRNKNTALKCALKSRCKNISDCLNEYKNMKIDFTKVQGQKLTSSDVISLKDPNKDTNVFKFIEINEKVKEIPEEEKKLLEVKMVLEYAIHEIKQDQIQAQFKLVQQRKQHEGAIKLEQQKFENEQKAKLEEALREGKQKYQERLKQKEDQLVKLRIQLKEMQQKRINQQRMQVQRLAEQFAKQQQQKLKQLAQNQQQKIEELKKQEITSSVQENANEPEEVQNLNNPKGSILQSFKAIDQQPPQQILQLYETAQKNGKFNDQKFPSKLSSIGNESSRNFKYFKDIVIWLRPSEIFKGKEYQLFDGIDPNDIQQGQLGICYMLATISSLAVKASNIEKLFVFSDLKLGFYVLRLYINGKPTFFVIDDQIPCNKNTKYPIFTKPVGNQLWVMLIQKCWAKAIGSYLSAQVMIPNLIMQDLSGAPGFGGWLQGPNCKLSTAQNIKILQNHSNLGHPIVITSGDKKIQGIVNGHAYTLMKVFKIKDKYIFKIRNPWGRFQWQGTYGQKSRLLTPQIKKIIGYTPDNDGIFFLSQSQLVRAFDYYSISVLIQNHVHSYTQFKSKKNENRFFKFTLQKPGYTNIRISQIFSRMINDPKYDYSSVKFQVGRIQNNTVKFIEQGDVDTYHGAKSINFSENVCEQLQAGDYFVRINISWKNQAKYNSAVLSVYASHSVDIIPLHSEAGIQYMKSLFYSHSKPIPRSSINQDGFYKIDAMKGQFVLVAQTDNDGEYQVEFKLMSNEVVGVSVGLGKVQQFKIRLPFNKNKPAIGSADIIDITKGGTTGPVYITMSRL